MYFHDASRTLGPAVADQERGRDGGRLDGDPDHPEVGRQDGEEHGGDEDLDQDGVERGPPLGATARRELAGDGADSEPGRQQGDGADDHHHEGAQGIGTQHPEERSESAVADNSDRERDPKGEHRRVGADRRPAARAASARRTHEGAQRAGRTRMSTTSISRAARRVRPDRRRRTRGADAGRGPSRRRRPAARRSSRRARSRRAPPQ